MRYPADNATPIISGVDTLPTVVATVGAGLIYTSDIGTSTGKWIGFQIIGASGWGAGFQIPVVVAQGFVDSRDIPSVTAIILFFLSVGGGILINSAQSGFVNTIIRTLPSSVPGVDPTKVVATGAREIRYAFPADKVPGIVAAYAAETKVAFAISLAACGTVLIITFLGGWRRLSLEKKASRVLRGGVLVLPAARTRRAPG
ncbi:hypothetical protein F4861DRAFT_546757 [Xylaria intraflava]|nr:hypothetical protein F4861DRAFT_546757 [Xylaria intraflava]